METNKALLKDSKADDVDVYLYRSMIGSLMYLTTSRPDIMFVVCACARFQVTPKVSHLQAVKRIFRYLKGQPKLGLWFPKNSPLDLEAYYDSDYAGASLDRKSTTRGCQFLGKRLVSWQCKKQTVVVNSTTKAEYVAAANYCGQVLWIQNQLLDYGYNFMNTKIFIDNESTIYVVKNLVFHSKTKHIKIRHHFIRDSYEKRLIQVIKIYIDLNVADLLTKAFDVGRFQFLIANIGWLEWNATTVKDGIGVNTGNSKVSAAKLTYNCQVNIVRLYLVLFGKSTLVCRALLLYASDNQSMLSYQPEVQLLQIHLGRKQRVRKPKRRDTEVTQPSEPNMVADEDVHIESNDPLSGEDRLKLNELMSLCTTLQSKVFELEKTNSSQQLRIESLERKVRKLKRSKKSRTHKLKRLYKVHLSARVISSEDEETVLGVQEDASKQGRTIDDINNNADITLVDEGEGRRDEMMFDAEKDLAREEVVAEVAKEANLNEDEVTLAQTLQKLKSATPKANSVTIRDPSDTHKTVIPKQKNMDKGKGKMVKPERPLSRKEQISFDEQEARRLQA
ncbi:hypothetical protein Tco_0401309 [Tanacetum coccineum]